MTADVATHRPARRSLPMQALSLGVLVLLAGVSITGFFVTRGVVRDQERKLLKQRTDEVALVLGSVTSALQAELLPAAAAAAHGPDSFSKTAQLLLKPPPGPNFKYVAIVDTSAPAPRVVTSVGTRPDAALGAERTSAIRAAAVKVSGGAIVGTPMFGGSGGARRIGFAFASPLLPHEVVYAESEIHPEQPTRVTASQPFSELSVVVYAVPQVRADQVLISTVTRNAVPLRGGTAHAIAKVGDGPSWLLVAKARHPLVGSVATAMPWAILGSGLALTLLATGIVETLVRRRRYAMGLVDARTEELRQSLDDLAAAHEQLVRQERLAAIGQLASTIGHELRNPLGVLSNAVYLLRSDLGPQPADAAQRHLATAEREISAATVIVSDLLEFAREREPSLADVDMVALVDEVLSVLPPPAGIDLHRDLPRSALTLRADRDMLRQVLLNVIGNAYQAMPDGGTVSVALHAADGAVQMRVRDTGSGMTDEVRSHLFEPFFTTKARGVGLGLAVSRRIVDAHHGAITVDSVPGQGAEFVLTFPSIALPRQADGAESANRPDGESAPASGNGLPQSSGHGAEAHR